MKSSAWRWPLMLGGWLLLSTAFAAATEYRALAVQPVDLQTRLNEASKDNWRLKSINVWTEKCSDGKPACLIVVIERG